MPDVRSSLRLKLTLWFVVTFAVVFFGILMAAALLHRDASQRLLDERLTQLAHGAAEELAQRRSLSNESLLSVQPIDRTFAILAIRESNGAVLESRNLVDTTALPPLPLTSQPKRAVLHTIEGDVATKLVGRPVLTRMVTYPFHGPEGRLLHLDLIRTTDIQREESSFLRSTFLVGAIGAMLASSLAAWLIAGRAVRPIRAFTEAAEQVAPERIHSRIDVESKDIEIQRLKQAVNDALERLEEGYRAQATFINNVAHELKTPLAVMLTESQVLRPDHVDRRELDRYRTSMISEAQRLGGLVESFLTLARADQGQALARMMDVSLLDVMTDAIAQSDSDANQCRVRVVATVRDTAARDPKDGLRGDPELLCTMVLSLLQNAIRYSPAGECVDIEFARHTDQYRISVRDRGPGISEEHLASILDRFMNVQRNDMRASGTGLGLAIATSVAEMHGGSIDVQNCPDRGCIFTVTLPHSNGTNVARDAASADDACVLDRH